MKPIAPSFDRANLNDLALIDVVARSGRVAGRIVVEHPPGCLDGALSEPIQVHGTDNVALKVDANPPGGTGFPDDCRARGQFAAEPGLRMRYIQNQMCRRGTGSSHDILSLIAPLGR